MEKSTSRHRPVETVALKQAVGQIERDLPEKMRLPKTVKNIKRSFIKKEGFIVSKIRQTQVVHFDTITWLLKYDQWLALNTRGKWKKRFNFDSFEPEEVARGIKLTETAYTRPGNFDQGLINLLDAFLITALANFSPVKNKLHPQLIQKVKFEYPEFGANL